CSRNKGSKFPVAGRRASVGEIGEILRLEHPILLDPCNDDPADFLTADIETGHLIPVHERGAVTIELLALNREELVRARRNVVLETLAWAARYAREPSSADYWEDRYHSIETGKARYAMFARATISHLAALPGSPLSDQKMPWASETLLAAPFSESQSVDRELLNNAVTRYVERIIIRNFRGIESLQLDVSMSDERAPWSITIGENGVGKSSVLHAIALVLSHAVGIGTSLTPGDVLRHGSVFGSVELKVSGEPEPLALRFHRGHLSFDYEGSTLSIPVAGYGATRLPPRRGRGPRRDRRAHLRNLFDPYWPLISPSPWLASRRYEAFDYAVRTLRSVLMMSDDDSFARTDDSVHVSIHGTPIAFDQLSDGYRSMTALIVDLIAYLQRDPKRGLESVEGILLLDEIGANLHPRWKMRIVSLLRAALPRVQVFATTHDPLCLRGTQDGEVCVLRRIGGRVTAVANLPPVSGLRVDQLLTSEYFGLSTTLDPVSEAEFERYYQLLAKIDSTLEERDEIAALRDQLEPRSLPGLSQRERLLLDFVDKFLVRAHAESDPEGVRRLRHETEEEIRASLHALTFGDYPAS
ncbi:MAG TPA: AAA family ATPase, partial [Candidatus Elarobacter sp.]|nr:AAA family ATPase [Candidatus Elarobacter sp.]